MTTVEESSTRDDAYADRLAAREGVWWKRLLDVQAPYRWNLRRHKPRADARRRVRPRPEPACVSPDSVGVDHNEAAIRECRRRGLHAYTSGEWTGAAERGHLRRDAAGPRGRARRRAGPIARGLSAVGAWRREGLHDLPPGARYASDPTHVRFSDGSYLEQLARDCGLSPEGWSASRSTLDRPLLHLQRVLPARDEDLSPMPEVEAARVARQHRGLQWGRHRPGRGRGRGSR